MKPTDQEISKALEVAEMMRERSDDSSHIAHCLLYYHQRNKRLEEIVALTNRYLKFGNPEDEHARLVLLLEQLEEIDQHEAGDLDNKLDGN